MGGRTIFVNCFGYRQHSLLLQILHFALKNTDIVKDDKLLGKRAGGVD